MCVLLWACVIFFTSTPHVTGTVLLLCCQGCIWVMGSVRRWQTRWGCEVCYRESPVDTSYPESYLKAATLRQDKVGQARPHSRHKLQHFITFQIISTHLPASFQVLCQVLLSLCGTEDTSKSTGCLQERNWFWQDTQDQEHGRYSNYTTV